MPAATVDFVTQADLRESLRELLGKRAAINRQIASIRQRIARPRRIPCHCLRCGHDWMALKRDRPPLVCARCGSRYWNRERQAPRYGPAPMAQTRDPMPPVVPPPPPNSPWHHFIEVGLPPPPPLTPLASPMPAAPEPTDDAPTMKIPVSHTVNATVRHAGALEPAEAAPIAPAAEGEAD